MNVLFLVLNEVEHLDEVLDAFVKVGLKGATILDSQGMASALTNGGKSIPFYGSLMHLLDGAKPYNKTIFTVIEDEEKLEKAVAAVKEILGDMKKPGSGLMFSVPIGRIY